ncbi:MAG: hypothetical protein U9Q83_03195 [Bacteroidota bacterium]|nr:hypothetical protein [Bacteroidota bacterium]
MKTNIIYLLAIVFLFACNNQENPNDELFDKLYGSKLVCPQNLQNINDSIKNTENFFSAKVKIVSNVFFSCGDCIKYLIELDDFVNSFNSNKIALIIYGSTDRSNSGIYTFLTIKPDFEYPIFSDTSNSFIKTNKLPENNMAFHTFLVDKNDSIRVIGSPVLNEKIKDLYKQEIEKILEDN